MGTVRKTALSSNAATWHETRQKFSHVYSNKRQIAVPFFFLCQLSPCKASCSTGESLSEQGLKYSLRLQVSQGCPLQNKNTFALIVIAVNSVETVVVLEPSSGSHGKVSQAILKAIHSIFDENKKNCSVYIIHWLKRKQKWCLSPAEFENTICWMRLTGKLQGEVTELPFFLMWKQK